MEPFEPDERRQLIEVASKVVTKTDVNKRAYVLTAQQRAIMAYAGFAPRPHGEKQLIPILHADSGKTLPTNYYESVREGSGRTPEVRMGRGILELIDIGDTLYLGTDGNEIFASTNAMVIGSVQDEPVRGIQESEGSDGPSKRDLLSLAESCASAAGRREDTASTFERHPSIRAFVVDRCGSRCEMPDCEWEGFLKPDGTKYIEVHHIESLGHGGDDSINNAAGLCPNCHRRAHYSVDSDEIRGQLLAVVAMSNENYRRQAGS